MDLKLKFAQLDLDEAAHMLLNHKEPLFYLDGGKLKQIIDFKDFTEVVSSSLKIYQQLICSD